MSTDPIDLHALSGVYVLDALEDDERAAFETHLLECSTCREEVRGLRESATLLSHDTATPAPDSLRTSVLGAIASVRPLPPLAESVADESRADSTAPGDEVATRRDRRASWLVRGLAVAAALLAIATATLGGLNQSLRHQLTQADATSTTLGDLLASSDVQVSRADVETGGQAAIVSSQSADRAVFVGARLTTLPSNQTYQLWLIGSTGGPVSAGTFNVSATGPDVVSVSGDLQPNTTMAMTVEPAGGSPAPTSQIIMKTVIS